MASRAAWAVLRGLWATIALAAVANLVLTVLGFVHIEPVALLVAVGFAYALTDWWFERHPEK